MGYFFNDNALHRIPISLVGIENRTHNPRHLVQVESLQNMQPICLSLTSSSNFFKSSCEISAYVGNGILRSFDNIS